MPQSWPTGAVPTTLSCKADTNMQSRVCTFERASCYHPQPGQNNPQRLLLIQYTCAQRVRPRTSIRAYGRGCPTRALSYPWETPPAPSSSTTAIRETDNTQSCTITPHAYRTRFINNHLSYMTRQHRQCTHHTFGDMGSNQQARRQVASTHRLSANGAHNMGGDTGK